jgi:hypothetical protein
VPVPQPAASTLKINDLIPKVAAYLQNRSDVNETQANAELRPSAWIRDTLREITANYEFEELRIVGPLVTIGPNLGWQGSSYMYPVSLFLNQGDDYTLSWDPVIFLTPGQAASVGLVATTSNTVGYAMDRVSEKAIQSLLFIPGGVPFKYCRFGNMFWFGSVPGQNYNVYLPYQRRHPFTDNLPNSPIYIPDDWLDVLAIGSAERGATILRWNDQATYLHGLLYGDPKYQQSGGEEGRPGLISARILQPERDKRLSPVQLVPGVSRY